MIVVTTEKLHVPCWQTAAFITAANATAFVLDVELTCSQTSGLLTSEVTMDVTGYENAVDKFRVWVQRCQDPQAEPF